MRVIPLVIAGLTVSLALSGCAGGGQIETAESMKAKLISTGVGCSEAEINSYGTYSLMSCNNANGEYFQVSIGAKSLLDTSAFDGDLCEPGYEPGPASMDPIVAGANWYIQGSMNSFTRDERAQKLGGKATTYYEACPN